ncbi:iron dicitrate transport regulator FecR [Leptospira langatensis]|uniref:Iron dicitrate transport regulator FecR n=1 Tax=Leptospira langatensis TaxID=2484983 RepID=A0A5F1ZTU3_9LEPT|nr:iron dicitrate transport regulator FecR [Leptospira langatensis]TGK01581.1 iron dicitrate transport regulator FecR [Leptospira langatensis]TGL41969.1 iron dicitrate transport regulator FecR [Leptospira langatensis]
MSLNTEQTKSFEELLESYISGEINAAGKKRLLEFVLHDPDKAEEYRQITRIQSKLQNSIVEASDRELQPNYTARRKVIFLPKSVLLVGAAALILLSIGFYLARNPFAKQEPANIFTQSYGDCSSNGEKLEPGQDITGKEIRSGKFSVCDIQLEGRKSATVRALPETDFIAEHNEEEIHINLGYGGLLLDSLGPKNSESVFITATDFKLTLEGTKVSLDRNRSNHFISVQVLEGRVRLESGDAVFWESLSSVVSKKELELLQKEYPNLFDKQQVLIDAGRQISWPGLSKARIEGLRKIEDAIRVGKNRKPDLELDEELIKSLKSQIDALPKAGSQAVPSELKNSLKDILPKEKAELEKKFSTMVRFPTKDLKEKELLMNLVKKIDKTSTIELLKEKSQPQEIRVLHMKDGTSETGYIYQQDNFFIVLKAEGNLIIPVEAVDRIEYEY